MYVAWAASSTTVSSERPTFNCLLTRYPGDPPGAGSTAQGSLTGEVLEREREEEREWPSRHGPSSRACVDSDICGMNISALRGNSCIIEVIIL